MQKINVNKIYFIIGFNESLKLFTLTCYVDVNFPTFIRTARLFSDFLKAEHLKAVILLCKNEKRSVLYLKSQLPVFKKLSYFIICVIPGTDKEIRIESSAIAKLPTLIKTWLKNQKGVVYP